MTRRTLIAWTLLVIAACGGDDDPGPLSREQLMDPETCKTCHPIHYKEWSGSMHAYASADPVFLAMNQRGQREAKLGTFCVNCHAPMAVREGATNDGLNLSSLPRHLQGITCYFCHNAVDIGEPHNNSLVLANDTTMRGPIDNPVHPSAHGVAYTRHFDRNTVESSAMCGACHDIQTPAGVHLERTLKEYQESIYPPKVGMPGFDSCASCHMDPKIGVAAVYPGVGTRKIHEHLWPAVDVPLTEFPNREIMYAAVQNCALPNSIFLNTLSFDASADAPGVYRVTLETQAGHSQPSGSSQDRRMWVELTAFDATGKATSSSGLLADNQEDFETPDANGNPVWTLHDRIFNATGKEAHMFWDAAPSAMYPTGYESRALPVATPANPRHGLSRDFILGIATPTRVELRVRIRPIALAVLQDLVTSKDLDPAFVAAMPTFTVASATITWNGTRPDDFTVTDTSQRDCEHYKCLLRGNPSENCGDGS